MQKAHNRVAAYFVFGIASNLNRAQRLAEYELYYGNAELMRDELARYQAVTREDVQRVARRYLTPTGRTVLKVMPAAEEE